MRRPSWPLFLAAIGALLVALGGLAWEYREQGRRLTGRIVELQQANLLVEQARANTEIRAALAGSLVIIGDSIAQLWAVDKYFAGQPAINRGFGGEDSSTILARFPAGAIALNPRTIVLIAGTNDFYHGKGDCNQHIATIEANARKAAELAQKAGARLVLAAVPPQGRAGTPLHHRDCRAAILATNARLKGIVPDHLDLMALLGQADGSFRSDLSRDGLHPNERGLAAMTEAVRPLLQR